MARLFECLVVYGAGLTLASCGARSQLDGLDAPADGGSGGGASTGKAGTGASAIGGRPDLGIGGTIAIGGMSAAAGTSAVAGTTAGGSAGAKPVEVPPGAQGQWSCHDEIVSCGSGVYDGRMTGGFALGSPCMSDRSRPTSAADCPPGKRFACQIGFYGDKSLLFNCECVAPVEDCPCPTSIGGCFKQRSPEVCDKTLSACHCAYTCILK